MYPLNFICWKKDQTSKDNSDNNNLVKETSKKIHFSRIQIFFQKKTFCWLWLTLKLSFLILAWDTTVLKVGAALYTQN